EARVVKEDRAVSTTPRPPIPLHRVHQVRQRVARVGRTHHQPPGLAALPEEEQRLGALLLALRLRLQPPPPHLRLLRVVRVEQALDVPPLPPLYFQSPRKPCSSRHEISRGTESPSHFRTLPPARQWGSYKTRTRL